MSAHTPGPWFQGNHPSIDERVYAEPYSQFIAECWTADDAKLIAAAPDLLKAAQDALSDMAWAEKAVPGTNFQSSIIPLTAAIAKATGDA